MLNVRERQRVIVVEIKYRRSKSICDVRRLDVVKNEIIRRK